MDRSLPVDTPHLESLSLNEKHDALSTHNCVNSLDYELSSHGLNCVNSQDGKQSSCSINRVNSVENEQSSRSFNRVNSVDGEQSGRRLSRVNSCEGRSLSRANSVEGAYVDCDCDACLLGFDDTQSDGETKPEKQAKLRKAVNVFPSLIMIVCQFVSSTFQLIDI